jgi:ribosomal protein S18 acetylase RimI-like enzyme
MIGRLWRVTRNPYGRVAYERLADLGVTGTIMYRYVRDPGPVPDREAPPDVEFDAPTPADAPDGGAFEQLSRDDRAVLARVEGSVVGWTFVSDRTVTVEALDRDVTVDGAYVWRVYVDPDQRNRGIATAMVARAVGLAEREFDRERCVALIAVDNRPSQRLFESLGFEPRRRHTYYRVGPWSRRTDARLQADKDI